MIASSWLVNTLLQDTVTDNRPDPETEGNQHDIPWARLARRLRIDYVCHAIANAIVTGPAILEWSQSGCPTPVIGVAKHI